MLFALDILCQWAMVSIKRLLQLFPTYQVFTGFVCCFTLCLFVVSQNYFINLFLLWSDYCKKIMHFQNKTSFFSYCWSVLIFLICVCASYGAFHSSDIMKLQIVSYLHLCITFYLVSHQVMNNKRIYDQGLPLFSRFPKKLS